MEQQTEDESPLVRRSSSSGVARRSNSRPVSMGAFEQTAEGYDADGLVLVDSNSEGRYCNRLLLWCVNVYGLFCWGSTSDNGSTVQFNVRLKIIIMLIIEVPTTIEGSFILSSCEEQEGCPCHLQHVVQCWWSSSSAWPLWQLKSCEEEDDTRDVLHFPMACPWTLALVGSVYISPYLPHLSVQCRPICNRRRGGSVVILNKSEKAIDLQSIIWIRENTANIIMISRWSC